ncbi:MAG TPA: PAS domain-containing protein, partial [Candidatus Binataceae bacterium]|nr:PAS domain-containing protein [Candidatus Binataceae bacterium]
GWALLTPLSELTEALHSVSQRKNPGRLPAQRFAELDAVAREFNHMADKIEEYEKLSIERILYEKSKTEAIIEGLGDGIILLNPERVVSHLNQTAATILGVDREDTLGSPFDDLSCNNPHYIRLLEVLQKLRKLPPDQQHTEVQLHFQDRDRFYVFKRVPLSQKDGHPLGVLIILQDVTQVHEHHRAHARLVSALSVELKEPLGDIASSAERLEATDGTPPATQHELVEKIRQDCERLKKMADDLMNLVRRETE